MLSIRIIALFVVILVVSVPKRGESKSLECSLKCHDSSQITVRNFDIGHKRCIKILVLVKVVAVVTAQSFIISVQLKDVQIHALLYSKRVSPAIFKIRSKVYFFFYFTVKNKNIQIIFVFLI